MDVRYDVMNYRKKAIHTCGLLFHWRTPSVSPEFSFVALPSFSAHSFQVVLSFSHVYVSYKICSDPIQLLSVWKNQTEDHCSKKVDIQVKN